LQSVGADGIESQGACPTPSTVRPGQILDIFNDLTGAVWSFTATVSEAAMSGTINQGTGTFSVSR